MSNHEEPEIALPVTQAWCDYAGVSHPTLVSYIRDYQLTDGRPLGMKVAGRWRVFPSRLDLFLAGSGEKKPDTWEK